MTTIKRIERKAAEIRGMSEQDIYDRLRDHETMCGLYVAELRRRREVDDDE